MRDILNDEVMDELAKALSVCVGEYYRDPAHRREFEEEQRTKKPCQGCGGSSSHH